MYDLIDFFRSFKHIHNRPRLIAYISSILYLTNSYLVVGYHLLKWGVLGLSLLSFLLIMAYKITLWLLFDNTIQINDYVSPRFRLSSSFSSPSRTNVIFYYYFANFSPSYHSPPPSSHPLLPSIYILHPSSIHFSIT